MKMFLIQSYVDLRAYIVDNDDTECNGKQVHEIVDGDEVRFKLGKKQHDGKVIDFSSNPEYLKNEMTTFNKVIDNGRKTKLNDKLSSRPKRKIVPKKSWSPTNSPSPKKSKSSSKKKGEEKKKMPTKKSANKLLQSSSSSEISVTSDEESGSDSDKNKTLMKKQISPSKEELKQRIALLEAEKTKHESTQEKMNKDKLTLTKVSAKIHLERADKSMNENLDKPEEPVAPALKLDDIKENLNSAHLFPPEFDDGKMTNIGNDVYCKNVIYESATGASKKATYLARRLLEGVFTHEALMNCTLTGQAPRGKDTKPNTPITPLNERGKNAIVDFALLYAARKQWPRQEPSIILKEMGQKLTEYKGNHKNAARSKND